MSNVHVTKYLNRLTGARPWRAPLGALSVVGWGTACANHEISTCTGEFALSVVLAVRDSVSRASLDAIARVTIRDVAAPLDSLVGTPYQASFFAPNRVATFAVRVDALGYRTKATEIVVPASTDKCGTSVTQRRLIELVPLAAAITGGTEDTR